MANEDADVSANNTVEETQEEPGSSENQVNTEEQAAVEPFAFDSEKRDWAISELESIMDLIRWANCTLSDERHLGEVITEELVDVLFDALEEDLDRSIFWDYATVLVFNALYLPMEKATMLMYSKLSEAERENIILTFEHRITDAMEVLAQQQAEKVEVEEDCEQEQAAAR